MVPVFDIFLELAIGILPHALEFCVTLKVALVGLAKKRCQRFMIVVFILERQK